MKKCDVHSSLNRPHFFKYFKFKLLFLQEMSPVVFLLAVMVVGNNYAFGADFKTDFESKYIPIGANRDYRQISFINNSVGESYGDEYFFREARRRKQYKQEEIQGPAEDYPLAGGAYNYWKRHDLLAKVLPYMVVPFLISSSMIPMILTSLKFMLLKSLFVGKIAVVLLVINALWRSNSHHGGVYSHNVNLERDQRPVYNDHYGYNGGQEYGGYMNKDNWT